MAKQKVTIADKTAGGSHTASEFNDIKNALNNNADELDLKADKVTGKGLSEEDYTTAEKNKLAGVETGAEVNTVSPSDISEKQDTLVSGTNIKTINSESLLGSGDLVVQGGDDFFLASEGYETKSALDAVTPASGNPVAVVMNDTTATNNGFYRWDGSVWVKRDDFYATVLNDTDESEAIVGKAVKDYLIAKKVFVSVQTQEELFKEADEFWESGTFNEFGQPQIEANTTRIRYKDYVEVSPNTLFNITRTSLDYEILVVFYDNTNAILSGTGWIENYPASFTTPVDCVKIKLLLKQPDGTANAADITVASTTDRNFSILAEGPSFAYVYNQEKSNSNESRLDTIENNTLNVIRGTQAVNDIRQGSIKASGGMHHDCQVMVTDVGGYIRLYVIYRGPNNYFITCRDPFTNELYYSHSLVSDGGYSWAPRMYQKDSDTIRLVYTKSLTSVFYRDLTLSTEVLGNENPLLVSIKDGSGNYDTPQPFVLDRFLQHCANVTGIDYRDVAYDSFASRNLLVEDTQQMQEVGGLFYLTAEVLADSTPHGDTGGIACLIESTNKDTWVLKDPVKVSTDVDQQRDHEISATYLDGKWHALSRWNNNTFDDTSGFRYYTSSDGDTWTDQGIFDGLPDSLWGIRHGVFKYTLRYADPVGGAMNKTTETPAFIAYNAIPKIHNINEGSGIHQLRSRIKIAYTYDFITFKTIADLNSRNNINYPSIWIFNDMLYIGFSTGHLTSAANFTGAIGWTKIPISDV